jgi:hypothetical protein
MSLRPLRHLIGSCLAVAVFATGASAADLTFYFGGIKPGKLTVENVRTALDSSAIYGARLSTSIVPLLGAEHTLAFSADFIPRSLADIQDAKGLIYNSNLILNLSVGKVVPYVTAGLGIVSQYGGDDTIGTKFAINYGGGLKLARLAGPLGLRFDTRGYTALGVFSGTLNLFEVSGGILLSF